jgi:hypothetical protein
VVALQVVCKFPRADRPAYRWRTSALDLDIEVAKWSASRVHNGTNSRRCRRVTHIERVIESGFPRLRLVLPSDVAVIAAVHLRFGMTACWIKQLPVSPHPVHHAVMGVKYRVARTCEEVATRVATRDHN